MKLISTILLLGLAATAGAFGVPDPPAIPDVDLPDIEIPGLDIIADVQVQLDEIISSTEGLRDLIPDLAVLDDVSTKLGELSESEVPGVTELRAEIDLLRAELTDARAEITALTDTIDGEMTEVKTSIDSFMDGLPIPE